MKTAIDAYARKVIGTLAKRLAALEAGGASGGGSVGVSETIPTGSQVKVYRVILSQAETDAPIVTELENSLGNVVWTRNSAGNYSGTLNGAFPINKSLASATPSPFINVVLSVNAISVTTGGADDALNGYGLQILVYP